MSFRSSAAYKYSKRFLDFRLSSMKKARAVLPLVKPMRVSATGSSHYVGSYYDIDEDTGYYTEAGSWFTDSSPFPIKTFLDIGVKEGHFDFSVSKVSQSFILTSKKQH